MNDTAPTGLEIKTVKRDIKMFFGRGKKENEVPMSIEDMDKAIMQAVAESDI